MKNPKQLDTFNAESSSSSSSKSRHTDSIDFFDTLSPSVTIGHHPWQVL